MVLSVLEVLRVETIIRSDAHWSRKATDLESFVRLHSGEWDHIFHETVRGTLYTLEV